jgi:hypothetical protein
MGALRYIGHHRDDFIFPTECLRIFKGRTEHTNPKPPGKDPPSPLTHLNPTRVQRALSIYNGWIPFDTWLNMPDTTWSKAGPIAKILSGEPSIANLYLEGCGIEANAKTAGYFYGQVTSMEAICLIRELYTRLRQGTYNTADDFNSDYARLSRFLFLSPQITDILPVFEIAEKARTLDEFEVQWFSGFMQVNNLMIARRIFKSRVKKTVMHECLSRLRQRKWDTEFGMYYLLGILNRLYYFNPGDPYWNHNTLKPLEKLFFLFSRIDQTDYPFIRRAAPEMIAAFLTKHSFHPELAYMQCIAWLLYTNALQDKKLREVIEILRDWEAHLDVSIEVHLKKLSGVYKTMPYCDPEWAMREIREIVVVREGIVKKQI